MAGIWEEQTKPASFKPDGGTEVIFPVVSRDKQGGNRLPERVRPYRKGSKHDHTGTQRKEFSITAIFHNNIVEDGVGDTPPLWPDRLNLLEEALESDKVGTLHLPWERNIRCRAANWRRSATTEMFDGETISISFVTDNEDNLDGSAIENVSVRATIQRQMEEATFDAEREGAWDSSFEELTEAAAELEGALSQPDEFKQNAQHKAGRVQNAVAAVESSMRKRQDAEKTDDPSRALVTQHLRELRESAARGLEESMRHVGPTIMVRFSTRRDIYGIASELGQSGEELIGLNPEIPDLGSIPAGTPVRVFRPDGPGGLKV